MRRIPLVAVVLLLLGVAPAWCQRAPYTPEQLSLVRNNTECQLSPDGKTVAFVSDISGALELWTVPATGGWPSQLTNLNEQVSDIQWSPDGLWIVLTSDYGGNERRDLYRVPAAGGLVEKLTDTKTSENEPHFSPDGKRLAFTADPDHEFQFQLHVMDLATRTIVRLTHEDQKVQFPVWSLDGKMIAINRSGDDQKGDLLLIDAASGKKVVVEPPIKDGILLPEAFSPDGKSLLLRARNQAGFLQLAVLELAASDEGRLPKPVGPPAFRGPGNWDVTQARWNKDGIYFLQNAGGFTNLHFYQSPGAQSLIRLPGSGVAQHLSLDTRGTRLALLFENVTQPADAWLLDVAALHPKNKGEDRRIQDHDPICKQITFSLLGGVKEEELSRGEMLSYESFDKTKITALLVKPRVPRLGSPPPAIVYVHGGPNGQMMQAFDPYLHVLAEAGFAVIAPNYRGSTGYGKAFEDANNKDWGGGDLKDLVAAVQHFGKRGDVDPKRAGITGGSYGGYMTLMALSRTPSVWKAGVERYGMPDLVMDYMLTKSRFGDWYETEMGNPKTDATLFRERSPLPYLDDIQAPLLIFQGADDTNVPRAESDFLVAVLKELKKPHEYIIYDDEGHGFTKRKNLLDHYKRTRDFFVEHLKVKK